MIAKCISSFCSGNIENVAEEGCWNILLFQEGSTCTWRFQLNFFGLKKRGWFVIINKDKEYVLTKKKSQANTQDKHKKADLEMAF